MITVIFSDFLLQIWLQEKFWKIAHFTQLALSTSAPNSKKCCSSLVFEAI
jgi:hypothetical protein